jgi:hypothetical protein
MRSFVQGGSGPRQLVKTDRRLGVTLLAMVSL